MKNYLFIFFSLCFFSVNSQNLVKDINPFPLSESLILSADTPVNVNNVIFFVANDKINGYELWKTDGTSSGTTMVRDIFPGPDDGYPRYLTEMNGVLYFSADDGVHGNELWKSDGTAAGTTMVKNIVPSNGHSSPSYLVNNNGVLYFCAGGEPNVTYLPDRELWKSDGTAVGTVQVANLDVSYSSDPYNLSVFKNEVYFIIGGALFKSDGVTTLKISPENYGVSGSLIGSGNYLYFNALVPTLGNELCKTDGTAAGTGIVKNISPTGSSSPNNLTDVNGTLFFVAGQGVLNDREIWKSDGTEAGTLLVKDIFLNNSQNQQPAYLVNFNGILFFTAYEDASGRELWKSDGTELGTVMVKDIYAGTSSNTHAYLKVVGNTLFFSGREYNSGYELFKSDGTAAGTLKVAEIYAASGSASPMNITPISLTGSPNTPTVIFTADNNYNGRELWISDGTEAGTSMIKNIITENSSSQIEDYAFSNGNIYFSALTRTQGRELWKSDGTDAGTYLVKEINPGTTGAKPTGLTNFGGYIYFLNGGDLWQSDGTEPGTVIIKSNIGASNLFLHNGLLYFSGSEGTYGAELWRSDGTTAGTYMVKDIRPGGSGSTRNSDPLNFNRLGSILIFTAIDGTGTRQLWKTDGTEAGTVKIVPSLSITSMGTEFAVAGDLLFFNAEGAGVGNELWRTDGTDAGTYLAKNIQPETITGQGMSSEPKQITAFGNTVLFCAKDDWGNGSKGRELWRSDGSVAGTFMVKNINNVPLAVNPEVEGGSFPAQFTVVGNMAYFYAYSTTNGKELWRTDGTEAGTLLVNDESPGTTSGIPENFKSLLNNFKPAVVADAIYYTSGTPETGMELYKADMNGTTLIKDLIIGSQGSSPSSFFAADDVLYFYTNDGIHAGELWSFQPPVPYFLPNASAQTVFNINQKNTAVLQNQLIARVKQIGAAPLNHNIHAKVTVDPSVQTYNSQPYVQRHYDLEPEWDAANATATVTLFFKQQEFDNFNSFLPINADNLPSTPSDLVGKARLRITQFHGVGNAPGNYTGATETIDPSDEEIVWNSTNNWWEITFEVTGFSGFYVTSVSGILPVKLQSFKALKGRGKTVDLHWKVTEQAGIENYIVEHSSNGINFFEIGNINANTLLQSAYYFVDENAKNINYYRLKIEEQDGRFSYSHIEKIKFDGEEKIKIYPNPVTDKLIISSHNFKNMISAKLFNAQGALVIQQYLTPIPDMYLMVNHLPSGTYQLLLTDGVKEVRTSFIKQ